MIENRKRVCMRVPTDIKESTWCAIGLLLYYCARRCMYLHNPIRYPKLRAVIRGKNIKEGNNESLPSLLSVLFSFFHFFIIIFLFPVYVYLLVNYCGMLVGGC